MIVPISVALLLLSKGRRGRIFWSIATFLCSIGLYLTGTRAGWLAFAILLLVGVPLLWKYLLPRKYWILGIALAFLCVAVAEQAGGFYPYSAPC